MKIPRLAVPDNPFSSRKSPGAPVTDCFLIARSRSGTTVLRSFMETNPKIYAFGELFNEQYRLSYYHYLSGQVKKDPDLVFPSRYEKNFFSYLDSLQDRAAGKKPSTEVCVYDLKYSLLRHLPAPWEGPFSEPNLLSLIAGRTGRAIHLIRRNHLRREISNQLMLLRNQAYGQLRNKFHFSADDRNAKKYIAEIPRKVRVEAGGGKLVERFTSYDNQTRRIGRILHRSMPCLDLEYERLFCVEGGDRQVFRDEVVASVADFLGAGAGDFQLQPRLLKATPHRLEDLLENYDTVARDLQGTPYEWCLEEEAVVDCNAV